MEALALIICIGVVIYGFANHKNETIIISCVLVCVLGDHSLFSLLQTPIETTEIVNEEGDDAESEETEEKLVESNNENEVIVEQKPSEKLQAKADRHASMFRINKKLFRALIQQESRWRKAIRSPVGATGLGQVMPFNVPLCTKEKLNESERVAWLKNPDNNLYCSAKILKSELVYWDRKFPDDAEKAIKHALGSYNAGRSAVEFKNAITAYRETRNYVATIWSNYNE
jgi:soluble lytic murein transglycosylase-like protein